MEEDALRTKTVDLVSRLFNLAEDMRRRSLGEERTSASHRYWQGVAFGLEMAVGEVLIIIEELTQNHTEDTKSKLDTLRANLIELAARLSHLTELSLRRGRENEPVVATQDYWQGVSFGMTMAIGEVLTLTMETGNPFITP
jgi:hypothetical protein